MSSGTKPFNTAVFYDIENLLKGYNFSHQFAADLSLKEILGSITETGMTGRVAVQRAYANWSDPRLGILRSEINALGIDPIQVFGFSKDAKKNAADIQLAIDAIDLAHTRPAIETFVIVSGDGGFAALAKKLHEYGRSVIGCAYRNSTNQTFQSVCDAFVRIDPPEDEEETPRKPDTIQRPTQAGPPNHAVADGGADVGSSGTALQEEVANKVGRQSGIVGRKQTGDTVRKILEVFSKTPAFRKQMDNGGIPLQLFGQLVRECIPSFTPMGVGFPKLMDVLRWACVSTRWQVGRRLADNALMVVQRSTSPKPTGFAPLDDLNDENIHSKEFYLYVLRQGALAVRLIPSAELRTVAEWICLRRPSWMSVAEIVERCSEAVQDAVSVDSVKKLILTLAAVDVFERSPESAPLSEQKLNLRYEYMLPEAIVDRLRDQARIRLRELLGKVDEAVLGAIV